MQPQQTPAPARPESNPEKGSIDSLPQPITPEQGVQKVEQEAVAGQEKASTPGGDAVNQNAGMPPAIPMSQPVVADPAAQQPVVATSDDDLPQVAGDLDLIEKTWVRKAKDVVAQTKDDPYNQNKQMNNVKAGYIKKRYNKEIKQAE